MVISIGLAGLYCTTIQARMSLVQVIIANSNSNSHDNVFGATVILVFLLF